MNRKLTVLAIIVFVIGASNAAGADPNHPKIGRDVVLRWLAQAEVAARQIDNTERQTVPPRERDFALTELQILYAVLGQIDKAKSIAKELPEAEQNDLLGHLVSMIAWTGKTDEALLEANIAPEKERQHLRYLVARICTHNDIPRALGIAEDLRSEQKGRVYSQACRALALAGDANKVCEIASQIEDPDSRQEAKRWAAAARLAQSPGDLAQAARKGGIDSNTISRELVEIMKNLADKGDFTAAQRILPLLSDNESRGDGFLALADAESKKGANEKAAELLKQALIEVNSITRDEPVMEGLAKAARLTKIAWIQARIGDIKDARKNLDKSQLEIKQDPTGLLPGLAGNLKLITFLGVEGRTNDMLMLATQADGTISQEALPPLAACYAANEQPEEVDKLLKLAKSPEVKFNILYSAAMRAEEKREEMDSQSKSAEKGMKK